MFIESRNERNKGQEAGKARLQRFYKRIENRIIKLRMYSKRNHYFLKWILKSIIMTTALVEIKKYI